jgi:prevent-host-death family protein
MGTVNLREARKKLGALVAAAERGEVTVITRRGRTVARMEPVRAKRRRGLPDLTAFRASIKMTGKGLSQAVLDNRREERA